MFFRERQVEFDSRPEVEFSGCSPVMKEEKHDFRRQLPVNIFFEDVKKTTEKGSAVTDKTTTTDCGTNGRWHAKCRKWWSCVWVARLSEIK